MSQTATERNASHWTETLWLRLDGLPVLIGLILALTLLRLWAAGSAGLVPDETYYALWARHPQWGYFDHPPMVAWMIAASTAVLGESAFAVRLPFVLISLIVSWLVYDTSKLLFAETATARRATLWFNASFLMCAGGILATPDPPSVLFFALGGWAMAHLLKGGPQAWWLVFGVAAGLGVEAKYTNLFLGLSALLWLWLDVRARKAFASPWFWAAGVIALVLMVPNILWNVDHGWATVKRQFGRLEQGDMRLDYVLEFIITQAMCLNPFVLPFAVAGLWEWLKIYVCPPCDRDRHRSLVLLIALIAPMLAYMGLHVLHEPVQGNWPAPIYPALILLAAHKAEPLRQDFLRFAKHAAAPFGIILWAVILVYVTWPQSVLTFIVDPTNQMRGWPQVVDKIERTRTEQGAALVAVTQYSLMGELEFHRHPETPLIAVAERMRYDYIDPRPEAAFAGQKALIVQPVNDQVDLPKCFTDLKDLGIWVRMPHPARKRPTKDDLRLYTGTLIATGCGVDQPPEPLKKRRRWFGMF